MKRVQNINFKENWICRELPAVRLISPKPEPLMIFAGSPKFTMLKRLKNSARICRFINLAIAACAEGRIFDQSEIEVVKRRSAEGISSKSSKAPVVWTCSVR